MITLYTEMFTVDIGHADVAYSQFDAWKAQGKDPRLSTTERTVTVYYVKSTVTIDAEQSAEGSCAS